MALNRSEFMRVLPFKALYPQVNLISEAPSFFKFAKERYQEYVNGGFYIDDDKESLYIYQIDDGETIRVGIIGSADIKDIKENKILPHEKTLAAKEQEMVHLLLQRGAMIKPALIAYDDDQPLNEFVDKYIETKDPFLDIFLEDVAELHTFWRLKKKKEVQFVQKRMLEAHKGYIADGHHRCSTIAKLYENEAFQGSENKDHSILCAYFPFSQLDIYDFNRVIDLEDRMSSTEFFIKLSKYAKIKPLPKKRKSSKKFELTVFVNEKWYQLIWKNKVIKESSSKGIVLDSYIFNYVIMHIILEIEEIRDDVTTEYIEGTKGLDAIETATNSGDHKIGFSLFPVSKSELKVMAQKGIPMPPKSTAFVPRIKNGMLVQRL